MMALLLPKSAFVHVNKTGGTWVRCVLKAAQLRRAEFGDKHAPASHARLKRDNVFGFVRDPVTWLQSAWSYAQSKGLQQNWNWPLWRDGLEGIPDFNVFIRRYLDIKPGWASNYMTGMVKGAVFVGKYERLKTDLRSALALVGEQFDEKHLNIGPVRVCSANAEWAERCTYQPDLLEAVKKAESDFRERYGYAA